MMWFNHILLLLAISYGCCQAESNNTELTTLQSTAVKEINAQKKNPFICLLPYTFLEGGTKAERTNDGMFYQLKLELVETDCRGNRTAKGKTSGPPKHFVYSVEIGSGLKGGEQRVVIKDSKEV